MKKKLKILITTLISLLIIFIYIMFNIKQNVNKIYPSVIHVECKNNKTTTTGSGIVYDTKNKKHYIVTSYHLIKGYSNIFVYDEELNEEKATIINYDEKYDIAVLTVKNNLHVKKAVFETKNRLSVKDNVYVLTSILGDDNSYIVKNAKILNLKEKININSISFETIKLNYDVENGDSGSPVINKKGKVIGMVFLKDTDLPHYGYALSIDFVLNIAKKLEIKDDNLNLGALMTDSSNKQLLEEYNIDLKEKQGVVVLSLKKNYPLYNSGLKKGDIIVSFNNNEVKDIGDLQSYISMLNKNDEVEISYYSDDDLIESTIKLDK